MFNRKIMIIFMIKFHLQKKVSQKIKTYHNITKIFINFMFNRRIMIILINKFYFHKEFSQIIIIYHYYHEDFNKFHV